MKNWTRRQKLVRSFLQGVAGVAAGYGVVGAVLELWNLNLIPGRVTPGIWLSLAMVALWAAFLWRDRTAGERLRPVLLNGGLILVILLLGAYASLDQASLAARLANLAMNWSFAGLGAALFLRVRRAGEEKTT